MHLKVSKALTWPLYQDLREVMESNLGYAEQAWKYMTICSYAVTHAEGLGNKFGNVMKIVKVNPVSSVEQIW